MQVSQLSYQHHKNGPYVFKDLNLKLDPGKIHSLNGKNGTGKTILLNILSGKVPESSVLKGVITGSENTFLVNQRFDRMLADQFSFADNLKFAVMNRFPKIFSGLKEPNYFFDFFDKFNIDISLPVQKLSGGQRQILALLMVLQRPASLLLLDEPTATLDIQNAHMVFEFLKTLTQFGMTLLVVCHDQELINQYTTGQNFHLEVEESGQRKLYSK